MDEKRILVVTSFCDRPEREIFMRLAQNLRVTVICDPANPCTDEMRDAGIRIVPFTADSRPETDLPETIRRTVQEYSIDTVYAPRTETLAAAIKALENGDTRIAGYRGTTGHLSIVDIGPRSTYTNPRVDAIICVSDAVRVYLAGKGISPEKLVTIPKGHDPKWYTPAKRQALEEFGVPVNAFAIGFAGRTRRIKGVVYLVRALRHISPEINPHLLLAGDIDDHMVRAMLSTGPASQRVHCAGFREDAAGLMGACDAFVMPSLKREGLPRALVEAMAQCVPCVASSVGGIPELIEDGVSGFLVPPRSPKAIAKALTSIATDGTMAERTGNCARKRIEEKFHIDTCAKRMLEFFSE